jgi:hypothetical protein
VYYVGQFLEFRKTHSELGLDAGTSAMGDYQVNFDVIVHREGAQQS